MAGFNDYPLYAENYDIERFNFTQVMANLCIGGAYYAEPDPVGLLTRLHEHPRDLAAGQTMPATRETDQARWQYDSLYRSIEMRMPDFVVEKQPEIPPLRRDFLGVYQSFMYQVIRPMVGEDIVFQRVPTIRLHFPNDQAVGEFHTDATYGHPPEVINIWLPLTPARDSNSLHIRRNHTEEPSPVNMDPGTFLLFDGVNLHHGNKINQTGQTRVSFDARFAPKSQFKPSRNGSINTGLRFDVGEDCYYMEFADGYQPSEHTLPNP